jgi:hypothetical protein
MSHIAIVALKEKRLEICRHRLSLLESKLEIAKQVVATRREELSLLKAERVLLENIPSEELLAQ